MSQISQRSMRADVAHFGLPKQRLSSCVGSVRLFSGGPLFSPPWGRLQLDADDGRPVRGHYKSECCTIA